MVASRTLLLITENISSCRVQIIAIIHPFIPYSAIASWSFSVHLFSLFDLRTTYVLRILTLSASSTLEGNEHASFLQLSYGCPPAAFIRLEAYADETQLLLNISFDDVTQMFLELHRTSLTCTIGQCTSTNLDGLQNLINVIDACIERVSPTRSTHFTWEVVCLQPCGRLWTSDFFFYYFALVQFLFSHLHADKHI